MGTEIQGPVSQCRKACWHRSQSGYWAVPKTGNKDHCAKEGFYCEGPLTTASKTLLERVSVLTAGFHDEASSVWEKILSVSGAWSPVHLC